ncbi:MAG: Ig-like domain-containing protein [Propionibacteriaceae bacterium]|nr:Ig-like domain-containing protein [Propionibacteriaceae bacterium]
MFKPLAWLIALVLAVGGVTFYQGEVSAPEAQAVTLGGGWDGVFREDQLWFTYDGDDIGGWTNPGSMMNDDGTLVDLTLANRTQWFDKAGSANGAGIDTTRQTIAVGPLFMSEGNKSLAMAAFGSGASGITVIGPKTASGQVNAVNWDSLSINDPNGNSCRFGDKWSGEVNQKNGYLYVVGKLGPDWSGTNATGEPAGFEVAIYKLGHDGTSDGTSECLISSINSIIYSKSGKSVNQQWNERFPNNTLTTNSWNVSSDMAIDANGNLYLWARYNGSNGDSRHVLLSLQPPTDDDGDYDPSGTWYYEVARFFDAAAPHDSSRANGMAFLNGKLYLFLNSTRYIQEWDTLSGAVVSRGRINESGNDLASAQMAPVVQGTIYNDADGDGVLSAAEKTTGVPNIEVEIWQQNGSEAPALKGTLTTNASGVYHGLLPSSTDNFYLRVKQPQINGVNALQTYASGGTFFYDSDGQGDRDPDEEINTVTPYCHNVGGDYSPVQLPARTTDDEKVTAGFDCRGARADRIDPSDVTNPLAAVGGAYIVTKVDMNSDLVVAEADFGLSIAGASFGDAKANVNSTIAANGPRFVNTTAQRVWLGAQAASGQSNGVNDANSNAHASDDGVVLVDGNGQELALQNQVLAAGVGYKLRATAASDPALGAGRAGVFVAGWSSEKSSPAALAANNPLMVYGSTDDQGRVESTNYVVDPTISSTTQGVMRFIASQNDTIATPDNSSALQQYAPARNSSAANNQPWVSAGEVEDYQVWFAGSIVRASLTTNGGALPSTSALGYSISNIAAAVAAAPWSSSGGVSQGSLFTTASNVARTSPTAHPVNSTAAATTVTLTGGVPSGWSLQDIVCRTTTSGVALAEGTLPGVTYDKAAAQPSVTIAANSFATTDGAAGNDIHDVTCDFQLSRAASPTNSSFVLDVDTTKVGQDITGTVTVRDDSDPAQPLSGQRVDLSSDAADVTLKDSAGNVITSCTTGADGSCQVKISSTQVGTYTNAIHARVNSIEAGGNGQPGAVSPQTVSFTAAQADPANSWLEITPADLSQTVDSDYSAQATARDSLGNPVPDTTVAFTSDDPSVTFSDNASCVTGPTGVCQVSFTSQVAGGPYPVHALVDGQDAGGQTNDGTVDQSKQSPQSRSFTAGPVASTCDQDAPRCSSLRVLDPSVTTGQYAQLQITLTDVHGNPVTGKSRADMVLSASAGLTFLPNFTEPEPGVYMSWVTTVMVGDYTVYATPAPLTSAQRLSGQVNFRAGDPAAWCIPPGETVAQPGSRLSLDTTLARPVSGGQHVITATLVDGYCNPVAGVPVAWQPATALTVDQANTTAVTGADGTAQLTVGSATAADPGHQVRATYGTGQTAFVHDNDSRGQAGSLTDGLVYAAFAAVSCSPTNSAFVAQKVSAEVSEAETDPRHPTRGVTFGIWLRTGSTNMGPCEGIAPTVTVDGSAQVSMVRIENENNAAVYWATVTDKTAETVQVTVKLGNDLISPSQIPTMPTTNPQPVTFTAGAPVPGSCQAADGTTQVGSRVEIDNADFKVIGGQEGHSATATLVDRFCNPVPGAQVTWTPATLLNLNPASPTSTGPDGKTTVFATSNTPGSYSLQAAITAGALPGSPLTANFKVGQCTAGPDGTSRFTVDRTEAPAGSTGVGLTISLTDAVGVPCELDDLSQLTVTPDPASAAAVSPLTAGATGVFTAQVSDDKAETVPVTVQLSGQPINPAAPATANPQPLKFTVGAVSKDRSTWTISPSQAEAGSEFSARLTARDALDNPVTGLTAAELALGFDANGAMTVLSGPDEAAPGVYQYQLTQTEAQTYSATMTVNQGTVDPADDFSLSADATVVHGPLSAANSHVTASPAGPQQVGVNYLVTVTAADALDNPVADLTADQFTVLGQLAETSDPASDIRAVNWVNRGDGSYTFQLTSTKAETYQVYAQVSGQSLAEHPTVAFEAGGVCVAGCTPDDPSHVTRVTLVENNRLADGLQKDVAEAWAYDVFGNPRPGAVFVAQAVNSIPLNPQTATCTANADGFCQLEWTSEQADAYAATVKVDGLEFATSQVSDIVFTNGAADAGHSSLTVTPDSPILVGAEYTLTALVRDANANPVPKETVAFALRGDNAANASLSQATCTTDQNGSCQVKATSKLAGDYSLSAQVTTAEGARDIVNSPATIGFEAREVCVTDCQPVDPRNVTRVEITKDGSKVDEANQVTVFAYDLYGNPKAVAVTAAPAAQVTPVAANGSATDASGQLALGFVSSQAGPKTGNQVTVDGQTPSGSPFTLTWATGDIDPDRSSLEKSPMGPLTVDSVYTVTATVVDANNNPVLGAAVDFGLSDGPVFVSGQSSCVTQTDGRCAVEVTSTKAGPFEVTAKIANQELSNSPLELVFTPGPVCVAPACESDPGVATSRVEVIQNGQKPNGQARDIAKLWAYDKHGNPVPGAKVASAKLDPTDDLTVQSPIAATDAQGETTIWYTSTTAGQHLALVTVDALVPSGSPLRLGFGAGDGVPAKSSFTVTPAGPLTVGDSAASAYTVTTTVIDALDQPVAGAVATVKLDHAGPTFPQGDACLTGADGVCAVELRSTVAGTYGLQPEITAGAIGQAQSRVWTPDVVCGQGCDPEPGVSENNLTRVEIISDNQTADGFAKDQVAAWGFDRYGNPVIGAAVVPSTVDPDLTIATALAGLDASGRAVIEFASLQAGPHEASLTVGGFDPDGSPVSLNFVAGKPSAADSTVTVAPSTLPVGTWATVTVQARDANLNSVDGLTAADFTVKGRQGATSDPATDILAGSFVAQGGGEYTFQLTSTKAQSYSLDATLGGGMIPQHPTVTFTPGGVCVANCEDPDHVTKVELVQNNQLADGQSQDLARAQAYDTYGNPRPGAVFTAEAVNSAALDPQTASCTTGGDGLCQLAWTSTTADHYAATVTVDGLTFASSQLTDIAFSNGLADPSRSSLDWTPQSPIKAGASYQLTATVVDANGNPVAHEQVAFALRGDNAADASLSAADCQTNAAGQCQVDLTSRLAGVYSVSAQITTTAGPADIGHSPAQLEFEALEVCVDNCTPVDPSHVTWVEVTVNGATVGGDNQILVHAYDKYGNPVVNAPVEIVPSQAVVPSPANGQATGADGTLALAYSSTVAGPHPDNRAKVAGLTPAGSPFSLSWSSGGIDYTKSTLTVTPAGPLTVDDQYTLTARLVDANDNPVAGASVDFSTDSPDLKLGQPRLRLDQTTCLSGADGVCSTTATSAKAGAHAAAAQVAGQDLAGSPASLMFSAGTVCVAPECEADPGVPTTRVEVIQNGRAPDGVARDVAQVWAYDKHGNPVSGAAVTSAAAVQGDDLSVQPDIAATAADGSSTIWYTSTTAGNHQADVTVAGRTPAGSPLTVGFGAGDGDPAHSEFIVDPAGPLTVGQGPDSTYTVTTVVRDVFDAPVAGAVVTVGLDHPGATFPRGDSCLTDTRGVCAVEVHSTTAGTYGLWPTIAAGAIGQAASRVWTADVVCGQGCDPEPGVPESNRSRIEVTVDHQTADGDSQDKIVAYGFDRWGNPVVGAAVVPSTSDADLKIVTPLAGIDAAGRAELGFTSTVAAAHSVDVLVGGATADGSPARLSFDAGAPCAGDDPSCPDPSVPNDRRSRVEVTIDGQPADGQAQDQVTAHLFDQYGNAVTATVRSTADAAVQVLTPEGPTDAQGARAIDYSSTVAGEHSVAVDYYYAGVWSPVVFKPQPGTTPPAGYTSSPTTVHFEAGQVCVSSATQPCSDDPAKRSRVELTVDNQRADGQGQDQAVVHLFDAAGNPVAGAQVTAQAVSAGLTVQPILATAANGSTTVGFTSQTFGAHSARVFLVTAEGQVEIVFYDQGQLVAGKSSPLAMHFVRADELPAPIITRPGDGDQLNDSTPTFVGTGEPGATIELRDGDDQVIATTTVQPDGSWTATPDQPLAEGEHQISAQQSDGDGNQSPPSASVTLTVDTVAPEAPVVTAPADGSVGNDSTPPISGTGEPGTTITVTEDDQVIGAATVDPDGNWSVTPSQPLADGDHTFEVTATDPAGNVSPETTVTTEVDTVAPSQPVIDSPVDGAATADDQPTVSGHGAEPGATVTIEAGDGNSCQTTAAPDGSFACRLPQPLPEGDNTITAVVTDPAGNVSPPAVIVTVVDNQAPEAPTVTGPTPGQVLNDPTPEVVGQAEPGSTVTVTDEDGNVLCQTTAAADGGFACTVDPDQPLADGDHTFEVTATDPAGNVSEPTEVPITVDTTAPDAPTVTEPQPGDSVNTDTPTIKGEDGEPGDTIKVVDKDSGETLCSTTVGPDGTWECTVAPDKALPEGSHDLVVTATDTAGNVSEPTVVPGVNIDTTAPSAPTVTEPQPGDSVDTDTPTIKGEDGEPGNTIEVVDQGSGETLCSTTVRPNGTWECTVDPDKALPDGSHDLVVTETDPAGNVSEPTVVPGVDIDTTAPDAPTVTEPQPGDSVGTDTPTIKGEDGEPGDTITVVDQGSGETLCSTTVRPNGTWECQVTPDKALPEGSHDLVVTETDPAGNVSEPTVVPGIDIDTTAPSAPTVTEPQPGQAVDTDTPTIKGEDGEPGNTIEVVDQGSGETLCSTTVSPDGTWECTVAPDKALPEGPHDLVVTETDPAGNVSEPTVVPGIDIDTTAPSAPTVTEPQPGQAVDTDRPTIKGEDGEPGDTITVTDQDSGETLCSTTVSPDGTWECTVVPDKALPEGSHDLVVTETDPAGNVSEPTVVPGIDIDTTAPNPPTVTEPQPGQSINTDNPTIKGKDGEPGNTITVTDDANGQVICSTTVRPDGTWECQVPPSNALSDGSHDLSVTETDQAGNVSQPTEVPGIVIDQQGPKTPTVDTSDDTSVSGQTDPGANVVVSDEQGETLCSTTADQNGDYSCDPVRPLQPGDQITVTATDEAGNSSSVTVRKLGLTIQRPSLPRLGEQTATGHYFRPGESVTALMDGQPIGTGTADQAGQVSFTWTIPVTTDLGGRQISLVGAISGPVRGLFQVTDVLATTGSQVSTAWLTGAALAGLCGLGLLLVGWRRQRQETEGAARRAA